MEKKASIPSNITQLNLRIDSENSGVVWFDNVSIRRVNDIDDVEIVEENNYYPFGLKHKGYNENVGSTNIALKKTYNGKEFQNELGLNWHDYGARNYDASLGRWTTIDNKSELYVGNSTYHYSANNPIYFKDVDGNYYVGTDGKAVTTSIAKDGSIKLSSNASTDLKRMAGLINESGSATAVTKFNAVGNNETKVNFRISQEVKIDDDGYLNLGLHQAHDTDGNLLEWNEDTGTFNGEASYIIDSEGNLVFEEVTITIYEGTIQAVVADENVNTEMVAVNAHENEHNLNKKDIKSIKKGSERKPNKRNVERKANKVEKKVRREQRKKEK